MRFNKQKLVQIARKNNLRLVGQPVLFSGNGQRVYDFDVYGDTPVRRLKIVYFSNEKTIPNTANIYVGNSSKYGISYNSYIDLVRKIKGFRK